MESEPPDDESRSEMSASATHGADRQPAHGLLGVAVVGGGVMGLATALRLAQLGAAVTLFDARQLGGGATGTTFAWVNSSDKHPESYHRLNVSGMAEYSRLQHEFGHAPWLHLDGHVEWRTSAGGRESLMAKARRLRAWGYPVQVLTRRDLEMRCPELRPPVAVESVLYAPTEGYVDTVGLVWPIGRAPQACASGPACPSRTSRLRTVRSGR
jgi:glycine/D-amino acid oxidase-like deaminating enzyme